MTAEELDAQLAALDGQLQKLADTPQGEVRLQYIGADVQRLVNLYVSEDMRPQAEALLKTWSEGDDPLRKGIAEHWLNRAKCIVQSGGAMPTGDDAAAAAKQAMARPRHPAFMRRGQRKGSLGKAYNQNEARDAHGRWDSARVAAGTIAGGALGGRLAGFGGAVVGAHLGASVTRRHVVLQRKRAAAEAKLSPEDRATAKGRRIGYVLGAIGGLAGTGRGLGAALGASVGASLGGNVGRALARRRKQATTPQSATS